MITNYTCDKTPKELIECFNNAKKDIEFGKKGEIEVANYFINNGWNVKNIAQSHLNHDLVVSKGIIELKIEVKHRNKFDDLFIEDINNIETNFPGWIHTTDADFVIIVCKHKGYVFKPTEMLKYIETYNPKAIVFYDNKFKRYNKCRIVKIKDYVHKGNSYKEIEL